MEAEERWKTGGRPENTWRWKVIVGRMGRGNYEYVHNESESEFLIGQAWCCGCPGSCLVGDGAL